MLFDLHNLGFIKIQGIDAKKFLQGQLTCDVELITETSASLGAHCNPQGRIISLFHLFYFKDAYYLLMQKNMVSIAMQALKKYAVFFKLELRDANDAMCAIGMQESEESDIADSVKIALPSLHRSILVGNRDTIMSTLKRPFGDLTQWKQWDIEEGLPAIYPETSGKFLPHEINLIALNAVSFSKGCYTGQEIIARMHYRGKLKTKMVKTLLHAENPPLPGSDVSHSNKEDAHACGMIIDICPLSPQQYLALIVTSEEQGLESLVVMRGKT